MTTQNTKPTITEFNPPDGNVEVVSGTPQTAGYTDGVDHIKGANYNAFWRQAFRVADYLLNDERNIYVKCTSGDDTTGDGTEALPYKTIAKACSMVAPNAYTIIHLDEAGDYEIDDYITLINKYILLQRVTAKNSNILHKSFVDVTYTKNNLYKFVLQNSVLIVNSDSVEIDAPANALVEWNNATGGTTGIDAFAGAIYSGLGLNYALVLCDVNFSATPAAGGFPTLFYQYITSILNISYSGTITTNSQGYVIGYEDPDEAPITLISNSTYTIDNVLYSVLNGATAVNQILSTGALGATIGAFALYVEGGSLSAPATLPIAEDETNGNIETAVENWLNNLIKSGSISVTVTTTRGALDIITQLNIEIGGVYAGKKLFSNMYWVGGTDEGYMEEIQSPKPLAHNVITN